MFELLAILTVLPTVFVGIMTAFVCVCIKICDFILFPVMDFILHLFGM